MNPNVQRIPALAALLLLALLSACSTTPEQPRDVADGIALAYVSIETAANGVADAHDSGLIDADQRERLRVKLQAAFDHLEMARRMLELGQQGESQSRLEMANAVLTAVEDALREAQ